MNFYFGTSWPGPDACTAAEAGAAAAETAGAEAAETAEAAELATGAPPSTPIEGAARYEPK